MGMPVSDNQQKRDCNENYKCIKKSITDSLDIEIVCKKISKSLMEQV